MTNERPGGGDRSVSSGEVCLRRPLEPVITDDDGSYRFEELSCHEYAVKFSGLPEGARFTGRDRGSDDELDSDAGADGVTPLAPAGQGSPTENLSLDAGHRCR